MRSPVFLRSLKFWRICLTLETPSFALFLSSSVAETTRKLLYPTHKVLEEGAAEDQDQPSAEKMFNRWTSIIYNSRNHFKHFPLPADVKGIMDGWSLEIAMPRLEIPKAHNMIEWWSSYAYAWTSPSAHLDGGVGVPYHKLIRYTFLCAVKITNHNSTMGWVTLHKNSLFWMTGLQHESLPPSPSFSRPCWRCLVTVPSYLFNLMATNKFM